MHIGSNEEVYRYSMREKDGNFVYVESVTNEKDLGITFDNKLNFDQHISNITCKAQRTLGLIRRTFEYLDKDMFNHLYKSLVRPTLEYGSSVWSPHLKKHIKKIEDIQRRATKLVPNLYHIPYTQRLKEIGLVTLEYRRDRADMIQLFKSMHNMDSLKWDKLFSLSQNDLRGHSLKLQTPKCKKNIRLNSFSIRTISFWNSLSEETISSNNVNLFKTRLNKENWNSKKFVPSCYAHNEIN